MPNGNGLGFVSLEPDDLFRELHGNHKLLEPVSNKPPFKVRRAEEKDLSVAWYPIGCLFIKIRLADSSIAVDQVAKSEYMRWAIAESLAETVAKVGKIKCRPPQVLACTEETELIEVTMPVLTEQVWQFAEFRFDYKLRVDSPEDGVKASDAIFYRMVDFEREFCKALEVKFRNLYHLTILYLKNKKHILMDGHKMLMQFKLFEEAQNNNVDAMTKLMRAGIDPNSSAKEVFFPKGLLDEEQYFLYVTLGRTPLHAAAEEGNVEAIRILLDSRAKVNAQDNSGFHALYLGAGVPDRGERLVNMLLAWDADINLTNKSGYTALHNACGSGEVGAVRALIDARADLNIKSNNGAAPVHVAVINKQPEVLDVLKELRSNLDMPAFGGNTPVHEAVLQNSPDLVQKLFDLNADINIESGPDNDFCTPLRMAMERKRKKAMKKLKELGALERIEHEYEEPEEGEIEKVGEGEYRLKVRGRLV